MITKTINLYEYKELSEEAKEKALEDVRNSDFHNCFINEMLQGDLMDFLEEFCIKNKSIKKFEDLKLLYSLAYCQGDGLCFTGVFNLKDFSVYAKHESNHYFHSNTINLYFEGFEGEDVEDDPKYKKKIEEFKAWYYETCSKLEKQGYNSLDYFNTEDYICEDFEANEFTFRSSGKMENL